jgi:hypothetical protein
MLVMLLRIVAANQATSLNFHSKNCISQCNCYETMSKFYATKAIKTFSLKKRHPRNVEFYKIREMSFQESCKARSRELVKIWNLEPVKFWNRELTKIRSHGSAKLGVANLWRSGILNLWRPGVMNLRNHEIGNLRSSGICWSSSSEVTAYEDFLNGEIHESVGSQVKDVVSKSPGLVCELVAGL